MKHIILFAVVILLGPSVIAQPVIEWQRSLGGSANDFPYSVLQTNDGGFIVAGTSKSNDGDITNAHGGEDFWVVKLTASGDLEWQHSYGGTSDDHANAILQIADGGYVVAGTTMSNDGDVTMANGDEDFWLIKITSSGIMEWQHTYGGSSMDGFHAMDHTMDGGFILTGFSNSNDGDLLFGGSPMIGFIWLVKLDNNGGIVWQRSYVGLNAQSVKQTNDGGYIVGGDQINSGTSYDYLVMKLSSDGDIEWQGSYGYNGADQLRRVLQTSDDGFIVLGYVYEQFTPGFNGPCDGWIIKLSNSGEMEWNRPLGGSDADYTYEIALTADGGYIVTGLAASVDMDCIGNQEDGDHWVLKLDSTGEPEWSRFLGGSGYEYLASVQQTTDNGFILAGMSSSSDGDCTVNQGGADFWVVKLSPENVGVTENAEQLSFQVFPNPAGDQITLTMEIGYAGSAYAIRDQLGRTVMIGMLSVQTKTLDIKDLKAGIYAIEVSSALGRITERFMKE